MVTKTYLEEPDGLVPSCIDDSILIIACSIPLAPFRIVNELSMKALLLPVKALRKTLIITTIISCVPLLFGVLTSTVSEFKLIHMSVYITSFLLSVAILVLSFVLQPLRYKTISSSPRIMEEEIEAEESEVVIEEDNSMLEEISNIAVTEEYDFSDSILTYIDKIDDLDRLGITPVDYMAAGFKRDLATVCNADTKVDSVGFDFDMNMDMSMDMGMDMDMD